MTEEGATSKERIGSRTGKGGGGVSMKKSQVRIGPIVY